MDYLEFYNRWHDLGCFSMQQIFAWEPQFNRTNISNWINKGYIVKLRSSWYAFRECLSWPDFSQYVANRIYSPSYISLYTALSHYGMIPEEVMGFTSVTSLKTADFANEFGEYSYRKVKSEMMFGYESKIISDGRGVLFATPEKALLDLLYLNPEYTAENDMIDLRLDEDFMQEDFDVEKFQKYAAIINSKALNARIQTLLNTYEL